MLTRGHDAPLELAQVSHDFALAGPPAPTPAGLQRDRPSVQRLMPVVCVGKAASLFMKPQASSPSPSGGKPAAVDLLSGRQRLILGCIAASIAAAWLQLLAWCVFASCNLAPPPYPSLSLGALHLPHLGSLLPAEVPTPVLWRPQAERSALAAGHARYCKQGRGTACRTPRKHFWRHLQSLPPPSLSRTPPSESPHLEPSRTCRLLRWLWTGAVLRSLPLLLLSAAFSSSLLISCVGSLLWLALLFRAKKVNEALEPPRFRCAR